MKCCALAIYATLRKRFLVGCTFAWLRALMGPFHYGVSFKYQEISV